MSKKNRETTHIKPTSISRIVSLIVATRAEVAHRAFQWISRWTGKEEGETALPKPEEMEIKAVGLPGSAWIFGCSAGAAGEIAATYDEREGSNFNNNPSAKSIGEGEVNGIYYSNPLVASMKGVDGRTTFGSIDEYWDVNNSTEPDPYEGSGSGNAAPL
jgi:hypothetical protein